MATSYSSRTIPTTSYNWRDPVGRKYLATESWQIITTEDWKWIIAVDSSNTNYTTNRWYVWQTWDDVSSLTWSSVSSRTWDSFYTGIKPTAYTWRIIP